MTAKRVFALLGRRDEPTDAVEDYCRHLGEALAAHDFTLEIRRVPWNQHGWAASLQALRLQAESWRDTWVLVQYTALAWSERGFPRRLLRVLRILRKARARVAVVLHDAEPFGGDRLIDRLRRVVQVDVMKDAVAFADVAILTVPAESLSWLGGLPENAAFIPVGANLPWPPLEQDHSTLRDPPTIAVFGITGGAAGDGETRDITEAVRFASAAVGRQRLLVFGRHAEVREQALRDGLQGTPVEISVEGVIEGEELVKRFAASDVLLFLRGTISSRRSSAIAGIACGLPVIALRGTETAAPVTDAGVLLVDGRLHKEAQQNKLGQALVRVLSDDAFRRRLAEQSDSVNKRFLTWTVIAKRYAEILQSRKTST